MHNLRVIMSRARDRRRSAIILALLAASAFGVLGFLIPVSGEEAEAVPRVASGEEQYAFPVRSARARRQRLVHWVHAGGYVRPLRTLVMISRISGTIRSVHVREGMVVRRGDTLVLLEDVEYRLALERARVGLLGAQIEYRTLATTPFMTQGDSLRQAEEARTAGRRLRDLAVRHGEGKTDEREYLREEREQSAALAYATLRREDVLAHRSGLAIAQEMVERARRDLEATIVTAPFAGEVADCALTACGGVVPGQRLLTLLDLSRPVVEAEVLEHDIPKLRPGLAARVSIVSRGGDELSGTVNALNPLTDPVSGTYRVTVTMEEKPAAVLRPGMIVSVRIATAVEPESVVVPQEAVVHREGKPVVFVVQNDRAVWRYVVPGPSNGEQIAIVEGVRAGEQVITDGQFVLAHDARVTVNE
jgi:RND family efflux transporter MFP subunit